MAPYYLFFPTQSAPPSGGYLLDDFPGAIAAYGVRKLRDAYSGAALRVRSAAGGEQDIGFSGDDLDVAAMETFLNGNDGFVRWFYDQGLNGYDAGQAGPSIQPRIAAAGTTHLQNGKPAINMGYSGNTGIAFVAPITGFQSVTELTLFSTMFMVNPTNADAQDNLSVYRFGSGINRIYVQDGLSAVTNETFGLEFNNGTTRRLGTSATNYSRAANTQCILVNYHGSTGTKFFENGTEKTFDISTNMDASTDSSPSATGYTSNDNVTLGGNSSAGRDFYIQEMVFYDSDQLGNRSGIESNINNYYSVF